MDPDLKAYLDEMRTEIRALDARLGNVETNLGARIDTQGRELRKAMSDMEARLTASIQSRREDIGVAFKDITNLKVRVGRLERRVTALEKPKQ